MRIVAYTTEAAPARRFLNHIGEPAELPRIGRARGPLTWDALPVAAVSDWDALPGAPVTRIRLQPGSAVVASFRRRHPPATCPPRTKAAENQPSRPLGPLREGYLAPVHPGGALAGASRRLPRPSWRCYASPASAARAVELPVPSWDSRSDDKGLEPEGIAVGSAWGRTYAFVGLQRQNGIVVFDVSDPSAPSFVQLIATTDYQGGGDVSPEGLQFVPAGISGGPNPLLIVAYEGSGSTRVFELTRH